MAADMYTMTPGSAVADKLQEILTQRKLEARQALLDKLQQDEFSHRRTIDTENLGLRRKEGERDDRKLDLDQFSTMREGTRPGADLSKLDPKYADWLRSQGAVDTLQGTASARMLPAPGDDQGSAAQSIEPPTTSTSSMDVFAGDADYQKQQRIKDAVAMLERDPSFASKSPADKYLAILAATGQNAPAQAIAGDRKVWHMSPAGRLEQRGTIGPQDEVVETSWQPNPTAASRPQYVGTTPDGKPIVMDPDGQFRIAPIAGNPNMPINAKPSAAKVPDLIPPNILGQLRVAAAAPAGPVRARALEAVTREILASARISGSARQTISDVLAYQKQLAEAGQAPLPLKEIMADFDQPIVDDSGKPLPPMSQADKDAIFTILGAVMGEIE
jgi:hypothetical protein